MTENFRPKVTAITKSKDVDSIPIDELVGSLQSYELDLPKTSKSKSMALKSVDDVEVGGFDDELSATEIAYLAKNLETFSEITIKRQEVRTLLNLEILGSMSPLRLTTMISLEKE